MRFTLHNPAARLESWTKTFSRHHTQWQCRSRARYLHISATSTNVNNILPSESNSIAGAANPGLPNCIGTLSISYLMLDRCPIRSIGFTLASSQCLPLRFTKSLHPSWNTSWGWRKGRECQCLRKHHIRTTTLTSSRSCRLCQSWSLFEGLSGAYPSYTSECHLRAL